MISSMQFGPQCSGRCLDSLSVEPLIQVAALVQDPVPETDVRWTYSAVPPLCERPARAQDA